MHFVCISALCNMHGCIGDNFWDTWEHFVRHTGSMWMAIAGEVSLLFHGAGNCRDQLGPCKQHGGYTRLRNKAERGELDWTRPASSSSVPGRGWRGSLSHRQVKVKSESIFMCRAPCSGGLGWFCAGGWGPGHLGTLNSEPLDYWVTAVVKTWRGWERFFHRKHCCRAAPSVFFSSHHCCMVATDCGGMW